MSFSRTWPTSLRNPLAGVAGGLSRLLRKPTAPQAEKISALMQEQMTHLFRLVDVIWLGTPRDHQGKIELRIAAVCLRDAFSLQ